MEELGIGLSLLLTIGCIGVLILSLFVVPVLWIMAIVFVCTAWILGYFWKRYIR